MIFTRRRVIVVIIAVSILVFIAGGILFRDFSLLNSQLTVESVRDLVKTGGPAAPFVFILACAATNIFSPLVIMPFWIAGILAFPFPWSLIYIYIANLLGHSLNFLIAKRWGRNLIIKFTGVQGLAKIDDFTNVVGIKMIFLIRLMGGAATDYISYALGLTNIRYSTYIGITALAFIPWMLLNFYLIKGAMEGQTTVLIRNFSLLAVLGYVFTFLLSIIIYRNKKRNSGNGH
ncbi:VTT domain-containing protein [Patescibacteria group bacterium]|nr:VTT domain-containing protein [Patescibacteria group bacterium]